MIKLFEFQTITQNNIIEKFETENIILLLGEKDSGKSVLSCEFAYSLSNVRCMLFVGEASLSYTDFGCFPHTLLNEYHESLQKRKISNSVKKDIATTVSNIIYISVENTVDSILTSNEKAEISDIINHLVEIANSQEIYLIFDNVEKYDKKSMVFLYNIVHLILTDDMVNIKILIVLDQVKSSYQTIINKDLYEQLCKVYLSLPTDNDLSTFVDDSNYSIARNVPIKYLLSLKNDCSDLSKYYLEKLKEISKNNTVITRILYTLVLLDEEVSFSNLAIFLSDLPLTDLLENIEVLRCNSFIECNEVEDNILYYIPSLIKSIAVKKIPLYFSMNRFEIYAKKIQQHSPLDYVLKYWLFNKAGNSENACANAILAYCAIARGEMECTNEEFVDFDNYLYNSMYCKFYEILSNAYRLFNVNEYEKCFLLLNDFLIHNHFITTKSVFFSVYIPEFIFEMIFLRGMCIGRLSNCEESLIINQQVLLAQCIEIMNLSIINDELMLRMREQKLLLKTYLSTQSNKEQKKIYNEYFSICNQYQIYIRESTIRTREKWEIRYASFLLKANIVSGIPDTLYILEKGYNILKDNKKTYPQKYIKATCNLAGDYMWRNQYEQGCLMLENALMFINEKNWFSRWGIIYQMYVFSRLYTDMLNNPELLLDRYREKVWSKNEIRCKMHEPVICNSNYAILLAATGDFNAAYEILDMTLVNISSGWNYYNEYLLYTNLGMIKHILGDKKSAIIHEKHCQDLIEKNLVPTFSSIFMKKRSQILLDIYIKEKPVDNVLKPLAVRQTFSTGYCSDNYYRPLLFSDINYWAD